MNSSEAIKKDPAPWEKSGKMGPDPRTWTRARADAAEQRRINPEPDTLTRIPAPWQSQRDGRDAPPIETRGGMEKNQGSQAKYCAPGIKQAGGKNPGKPIDKGLC